MKTGGSNYITINGQMDNPVIGTYHLYPEIVESDLRSMYEHGQRKIAFLCWFAPLNFPAARDHRWGHVIDSYGGVMFGQHQDNAVALLAMAEAIGFREVFFRFGPQGKAMDREWVDQNGEPAWNAAQYNENWEFIRSVSDLVRANKGGLNVIFDLGVEHANERIRESNVHNLYVRQTWKRYCDLNGVSDSCGFSILHGGGGLDLMLRAFRTAQRPAPEYYCFDAYDALYDSLISASAVLVAANEQLKSVYILETNYNDEPSRADIERGLSETGLNFKGIIQWPKVRDSDSQFVVPATGERDYWVELQQNFPDVFCKRYDHYLVEL